LAIRRHVFFDQPIDFNVLLIVEVVTSTSNSSHK
jgi:hypothetical protein